MIHKTYIFTLCVILLGITTSFTYIYTVNAAKDDFSKPVTLTNPLENVGTNPNELIGQIINGVLGIVGSLALAMFIYGGLIWMTAAGANEKVQKGKDILIWATIGLVVIFSAYAMVKFVLDGILGV